MKLIRRLLVAALIILLVLTGVFLGVMMFDALAGETSAAVTNVTFTAGDGAVIGGYLARPDGAEDGASLPGVLMVHEWWGLNAEIAEMADKLAAEGYIVLAPDTYRGSLATTVPGALLLRISAPTERVNGDMQAAFDYLAALPEVDAARIGVMGFCYGGGVALRHAVANAAIAATINLYGDTIDDPAGFGALNRTNTPVLGIFGAEDAQIPVAEVEAFERALSQTGIPHTVTIYPGVGHAFVNPASIAAGGAAANAWAQILAFLSEHLQTA